MTFGSSADDVAALLWHLDVGRAQYVLAIRGGDERVLEPVRIN